MVLQLAERPSPLSAAKEASCLPGPARSVHGLGERTDQRSRRRRRNRPFTLAANRHYDDRHDGRPLRDRSFTLLAWLLIAGAAWTMGDAHTPEQCGTSFREERNRPTLRPGWRWDVASR